MDSGPELELFSGSVDYHEIIECIVSALDAKDPYTAGHSQRVSDMALALLGFLELDKKEIEKIHIAAHLHDIGKIGIPDSVLNKPERLSGEEWAAMKKHPRIGADILSKSRHLKELKDIVLYHHERFDGKGYPEGLRGEKIPLGARIIAICDSIDAMTSDRGYRSAYSMEHCYEEIEKNLGVMYDPVIGALALKHWDQVTKTAGK
ncbi:MAG TPA: phosphohydrolase [Lachnoclostridium sp.]|nr:HD-GYP domain-containing protein [Lacrimispora sp.]HCD45381.1 phosphohydrolase [Lachnoclostridium sp.]